MAEERIESLDMPITEAIEVMSGGNPGAMTVCTKLLKKGQPIDPDAFAGGFSHLMWLDEWGIHEEKIWMLYKDVCGQSLPRMIAVIRANQLGLSDVTTDALHHAINNRGAGLDVDSIVGEVEEELSGFSMSVGA